jgi:hypothetical protein
MEVVYSAVRDWMNSTMDLRIPLPETLEQNSEIF